MLTTTDPRTGAVAPTELEATAPESADAIVRAAQAAFETSSEHDRLWRAGLLDAPEPIVLG